MILVTGSSGYIGSSFIKSYKNDYPFHTFSLQDKVIDSIDFNNIEVVLHCAALVHKKTKISSDKYHDINVKYPVKLAQEAKKYGVKHFIFISTIAVYGEHSQYLTEDTECHPVSAYGKSKLEAELKLLQLSDDNFIVSIVRPPMVYGKEAPGNIASLKNLVQKVPILPFGGINNKRNFIYVGNLLTLINTIISKRIKGVFLAGDDTPLSTTRLIKLIAKELDKKISLVKVPFFETILKILNPSFHKKLYGNLEVNNTQTKKILNMKNPYSVEEGIHYMIHGELS